MSVPSPTGEVCLEGYMIEGESILFFDSRLWVCLFIRKDEQGCFMARHVFGAEPSPPEFLNFMIYHYDGLRFLRVSEEDIPELRERRFKTAQRKVRKERQSGGAGRSLEIYKDVLKSDRTGKRGERRRAVREDEKILYRNKQLRKKMKKRGK